MRRRDGRTVRSTSNLQFFYGPTGIVRLIFSLDTLHAHVAKSKTQVKYVVSVTLHWEEDTMREGEGFRENLHPTACPLPVLTPAPLAHPHHASSPAVGACGQDDPRDQAILSGGNADFWDQPLQSLAAPAVVHHPAQYL